MIKYRIIYFLFGVACGILFQKKFDDYVIKKIFKKANKDELEILRKLINRFIKQAGQ